MKLFNLIITSAILVSGLSATELKRSMKVVPMDPKYLSTENGGTNHASTALSDGIGLYTTQEDEYSKAITHLNGKYGDDALKNEKSLKQYVLDNGNVADKELANKLNLATVQKSNPGDSCDDKNPQTENDIYLDENFTCQGKPISKSIKCKDKPIGSEFEFEGKTYLVVDNTTTIKNNLNRVETLCTSNVTDMSNLFNGNSSFNKPIGDWDTSNVTNMSKMFFYATSFNQPIGDWDTGNVANMGFMFNGATSFNQPLNWNTSNVTDINSMFYNAASFNQAIGDWDTSNVKNMSLMFYKAKLFNQPIGGWNTSSVTNMQTMFANATSFNQPIGGWDTSNVVKMDNMFNSAKSFNQPLNWNTSNVTYMNGMFYGATAFNQPLNWNTGKVISMAYMFYGATSFNQPLNWDTSNVTYMNYMFNNATSFNQNISNWDTSNVIDYGNFAISSALTSEHAPSKDGTKFPTTH